MDAATRDRACRALTTARAVGGVFFSRIYVVGNEITFSCRAAQVMQHDAMVVQMAQNRMNHKWVPTESMEPVPIEIINFDEAFCWVYGTGSVPETVKAAVYKEMDEIRVTMSDEGHVSIGAADQREINARKGFVQRIREAKCLNV